MKCKHPCHAVCAEWSPDRRPKSPFHCVPFCLGCEHKADRDVLCDKNKRSNNREVNKLVQLRTEKQSFQQGFKFDGVVLGQPFELAKTEEMVNEDIEEFNGVRCKVPPANFVQLCKFMNPDKKTPFSDDNRKLWLGGKGRPIHPVELRLKHALHLWKDTWLNNEIVGACLSVLNSITVQSRTALFVPPTSSSSLHLQNHLLHEDEAKHPKRDKHGNVEDLKVCRSCTCGRRFSVSDAFKLGHKCVCFLCSPSGSDHWVSVRVTLGQTVDPNNNVVTNCLSCDVHDTLAVQDPPETPNRNLLFPFSRATFGIDDVREEHVWAQKENMVQRDGDSCGVFQCLLMERLALSVKDWWKGAVSTEAINKQRSKTAGLIMNIQGACTPSISDTGSNGSNDVCMDHNGHIDKHFEREVMPIDDEIPCHKIPLWTCSRIRWDTSVLEGDISKKI